MTSRRQFQLIRFAVLIGALALSLALLLKTAIPYFSYAPIWSGDGKEVTFVCYNFSLMNLIKATFYDEGNRDIPYNPDLKDICVSSLDGSSLRWITNNQVEEDSPQWSPDNILLSYISVPRTGKPIIILANKNEFIYKPLKKTEGVYEYTWIPYSKLILYASHQNRGDKLSLLDTQTDEERIIKERISLSSLGASPNGKLVSYTERDTGGCIVHIINLRDSTEFTIPNKALCTISPNWSLDSTKLVFENLDKKLVIFSISTMGFNETSIPYFPLPYALTWIEGNKIIGVSNGSIIQYDAKNDKWMIILPSNSNSHITVLGQKSIAISPDSKYIAVTKISNNNASASIWISKIDGSELFKLTN